MLTDKDEDILELLNFYGLCNLEDIQQWIDHTVKVTNIWLDDYCGEIDTDAVIKFSNWWNNDLPT